jgi:hypothetical protein
VHRHQGHGVLLVSRKARFQISHLRSQMEKDAEATYVRSGMESPVMTSSRRDGRQVYAARPFLLWYSPRIALARSAELAPSSNRALTSNSIETDGSPASILATLDWLDWRRLANSTWDRPYCFLRARTLRLRASFISIRAASASERPRNSFAVPTVHPAARSRARLLFLICHSL